LREEQVSGKKRRRYTSYMWDKGSSPEPAWTRLSCRRAQSRMGDWHLVKSPKSWGPFPKTIRRSP